MRVSSGRRAGQRFDATHRVTTEALTFLGELDPEAMGPNLEFATHYEATPVADFERLAAAIPIDPASATFVDLGSGMGRAVLLAAQRPFRQVIGVEFSPALHEIARENLRNYTGPALRCRDVRLVCADAADYVFPRGNLVVYVFNPFYAPVLTRVVRAIASCSAEAVVVYHTAIERAVIEATERFEKVCDLGVGVVYRLLR